LHPHTFYSSLFDRNKRDEVFVIMSFAKEFNARWQNVLKPAIEEDLGLLANRVDYSLSGESIVHDILDGIANARLVIADISSSAMMDLNGETWPQRNANVMWELGIAHSMRLPEEVIMVRSDDDPSIFDLTQFRAFRYQPDDVSNSRAVIHYLGQDRLKIIDQTKHRKVREAMDLLDADSMALMVANKGNAIFSLSRPATMGDIMGEIASGIKPAVRHLLSHGIIKFDANVPTSEYAYHWTEFGKAVMLALAR
jgi:hypothetical protein